MFGTFKEKGYLSSKRVLQIEHPETNYVEYYLERHINQIVLQLTQNCNLRCSYCAYSNENNNSQRNHSVKKMDLQTAKSAIDFMIEHSCDSKDIAIGLYGGEPLLEFELIKDIIEYTESQIIGKRVKFTITTNGTLLDNVIFQFLIEHNVSIVLSIDGPKDIHDINRKFVSGKGTFDTIYKNIQEIYQTYGECVCEQISINMVVDPQNDIDEICNIFKEPIFNKVNVRYSGVDDVYIDDATIYSDEYIEKYRYKYFVMLLSYLKIVSNAKCEKIFDGEMVKLEKEYDSYNKEYSGLPDVGAPSGPCIPGKRRLFVDVNGEIFPCERVSETSDIMKIDSLKNGFDYEKVKQLLNIGKLTQDECSDCYAFTKCSICARLVDDNGRLSAEKKLKFCDVVRKSMELSLQEVILEKEIRKYY